MGRPPIGKRAMTGAERIQRWRERQKLELERSVPNPTAEQERQYFLHRATQATEMVHFRPFRLFRTDYAKLADAAEQVSQTWAKAAKDLRRLHGKVR